MPPEREAESNHLVDCASPYLQEHAHNPVEWYPWGEEALRRAREEDKPILLSIGYSACHWCHVMRRECFEDPQIAAVMNRHFVNIKVDREERPDLDDLYMRAVQLLTGRGGWPLTVFLTPALEPFYGGTYFPPTEQGGMPAFPRVLEAVAESYRERREEVAESAARVVEAIEGSSRPPEAEGQLSEAVLEGAMREFASSYDMEHGGFGQAPKFLQMPALDFLLRFWSRDGDERGELMTRTTLRRMAAGGVFDQLGGGFHRYATDRRWFVPHFEKMLYDNAMAIGLYADSSVAFGEERFLRVSRHCADYMRRVLGSPEGAFYCAQDAESEGEEGKYYVWTYAEIIECLGKEEGEAAARFFGASEEGNWEEGRNILRRALSREELAELCGIDPSEGADLVERWRKQLLARRSEQPTPQVDQKVLTDWNALAVGGLLRLHRAGRDPGHREEALRCLGFLLEEAVEGVAVTHVWRDGIASVPGFLSDYALLCDALLAAYQATFRPAYLRKARELAGFMMEEFWEEDVGLFREAGERAEPLGTSVRSVSDQPVPSGASVACHVLMQLAELDGRPAGAERVGRFLRNCTGLMEQSPRGVAHLLAAGLRYLSEPRELVIVGLGAAGAERLLEVADSFYMPHTTRAGASAEEVGDLAEAIPLLEGRTTQEGDAAAYLCSAGACREPVGDPDRLRRQLEAPVPAD